MGLSTEHFGSIFEYRRFVNTCTSAFKSVRFFLSSSRAQVALVVDRQKSSQGSQGAFIRNNAPGAVTATRLWGYELDFNIYPCLPTTMSKFVKKPRNSVKFIVHKFTCNIRRSPTQAAYMGKR